MKYAATILAAGLIMSGCTATAKDKPPLTVVDRVDLERYLGKWYEIASYPAWFQKGCTGSTAEYSLLPEGKFRVINRCRKNSLNGQDMTITMRKESRLSCKSCLNERS